MYLAGLQSLGYDPFARAYQKVTKEATETAGAAAGVCIASGGVPKMVGSGFQLAYAGCEFPPATAAPAPTMGPITITVPTQVATQVSPQISPVFVQQDEPQNSPVNASTRAAPTFDPGVIATQQEIARQQQAIPTWIENLARDLEAQRNAAPVTTLQPAPMPMIPEAAMSPDAAPSMLQMIPPWAWMTAAGVGLVIMMQKGKR